MKAAAVEIRGVHHGFGDKPVLDDVNLRIGRGQFLALVGPSGCGKSTLLRAIVGTHLPRRGEIRLFPPGADAAGLLVTGPGRDRGIVYQQYALFPFLTALENVAIGLMLDETSIPFRFFRFLRWRALRRRHLEMAVEMLARVKLADALHLYPHEMSGGMRQRVALAQALIMKPEILLMDEPFGSLDEATREELQQHLISLRSENLLALDESRTPPHTLIIVTHELNEAIYVGDRVVGLSQHWDWRSEGHQSFPGATVTYDKATPHSSAKTDRNFGAFAMARDEIRRVVFEPQAPPGRNEHVTYWKTRASPETTDEPT